MSHGIMRCSELAAHQNNNRIFLDLSFQSEERWSDKQRQNFMKSIFRNFVPSPITLADVDACAEYCAEKYGKDSDDYDYFNYHRMKGIKFISIDGNNRTRALARFFNNEFSLSQTEHVLKDIPQDAYKNWKPGKNNKRYNTLPTYVKDFLDSKCMITTYIIKDASMSDLTVLFLNINDGVTLNGQEKRNAIICEVAKTIRNYSEEFKNFFSKYFSKDSMNRRNHEEFMASLLVHITKKFSGSINKSEMDNAYNNESLERNNLKKLYEVIKIVSKITEPEKHTKKSDKRFIRNEATLFDLCMVVSHLHDRNMRIDQPKKFFGWFVDQHTDLIIQRDSNNNPLILWTDATGQNARDYVGCQRSKDAGHREVRLKCYLERFVNMDEGIVGPERDSQRFYSPSIRVLLWTRQNKKCAESGEEISMEQVLDGNVTHIDHYEPHSKGGRTNIDNARLVFAEDNIRKSDSLPLVSYAA